MASSSAAAGNDLLVQEGMFNFCSMEVESSDKT